MPLKFNRLSEGQQSEMSQYREWPLLDRLRAAEARIEGKRGIFDSRCPCWLRVLSHWPRAGTGPANNQARRIEALILHSDLSKRMIFSWKWSAHFRRADLAHWVESFEHSALDRGRSVRQRLSSETLRLGLRSEMGSFECSVCLKTRPHLELCSLSPFRIHRLECSPSEITIWNNQTSKYRRRCCLACSPSSQRWVPTANSSPCRIWKWETAYCCPAGEFRNIVNSSNLEARVGYCCHCSLVANFVLNSSFSFISWDSFKLAEWLQSEAKV